MKELAKKIDIVTENKLVECTTLDWNALSEYEIINQKIKFAELKSLGAQINKKIKIASINPIPAQLKNWLEEKNIEYKGG